jgi:hypothetical protein
LFSSDAKHNSQPGQSGPGENAGKFWYQLVQESVILFIAGYRHIKINEMDPSPDGMIGSLDLGWIIGRQPGLAAGNELEKFLVQVSRCYLVTAS